MADQNRFQDLNDDDIDKFLSDQKNKNTTKKTASDCIPILVKDEDDVTWRVIV